MNGNSLILNPEVQAILLIILTDDVSPKLGWVNIVSSRLFQNPEGEKMVKHNISDLKKELWAQKVEGEGISYNMKCIVNSGCTQFFVMSIETLVTHPLPWFSEYLTGANIDVAQVWSSSNLKGQA